MERFSLSGSRFEVLRRGNEIPRLMRHDPRPHSGFRDASEADDSHPEHTVRPARVNEATGDRDLEISRQYSKVEHD